MRLSDLMSSMGLAIYPQVALLIFLAVFIAIGVRVFGRARPEQFRRWSRIVLDEEAKGGVR
jgi:hypothetical protein